MIRPRDLRGPRKLPRMATLNVTIRVEIPAILRGLLAATPEETKAAVDLNAQLDAYNAAGAPYGWSDAGIARWIEEQEGWR